MHNENQNKRAMTVLCSACKFDCSLNDVQNAGTEIIVFTASDLLMLRHGTEGLHIKNVPLSVS